MKIDDNEVEKEALKAFRNGDFETGHKLQKEFLEEVRNSGQDYCSCKVKCRYHGKCVECVTLHRGHGDHLPDCFRDIINRRIEAISGLTENSIIQHLKKEKE